MKCRHRCFAAYRKPIYIVYGKDQRINWCSGHQLSLWPEGRVPSSGSQEYRAMAVSWEHFVSLAILDDVILTLKPV